MPRLPIRVATHFARLGLQPNVLVWQPPPPEWGQPSAAKRIGAGVWLLEGRVVEVGSGNVWDAVPVDETWHRALHGHGWLDHAAAVDDPETWRSFSEFVWRWIEIYAAGDGPGWTPDLVARRLVRWIAYSTHLLRGRDGEHSDALFHMLGAQIRLLGWRWRDTPEGAERIEALTGLLYAQLSLQTPARTVQRSIRTLGRIVESAVLPDGSVASRSPEDLARILALLVWIRKVIESAGVDVTAALDAAIGRAEPLLRALRYPDGTLPRFHGGGSGGLLPLDQLCGSAPSEEATPVERPMGFVRVSAGMASLTMDGAKAPGGPFARTAHASALAVEFHDGMQPVIVSCGSGADLGSGIAGSARRAASHSSIELHGNNAGAVAGRAAEVPLTPAVTGKVDARVENDASECRIFAESYQYVKGPGLRVERHLKLNTDGTHLIGVDMVLAANAATSRKVRESGVGGRDGGLLTVRFHLHPDIVVTPTASGHDVALTLPDGTIWMMKADGDALIIQPSQYVDESRPQPRATSQIVARAPIVDYCSRVNWSLRKLQ